ncbi:DF family (seleno)protein [Aeromicrobium massiliense]|uniref:DF family (seleno)protein n=1 Tax=Aeromicrobium massiliense TaxID=1464554 RepID=UPI0005785811|nr:hypothetical protein [Aeromicrobium massiliense]
MRIQLLYFDDCPNWEVTHSRLRQVLDAMRLGAEVETVLVNTPEQAERWNFHGSPTILIDGQDPFAQPGAPVGLSCRLYQTPAGLEGSPTGDQLAEALAHS